RVGDRTTCSDYAAESCTWATSVPLRSLRSWPSCDPCISPSIRPKGHSHELQQLARLFVGFRRRHHRNIHAPGLVNLHVVDLREQQLVAQSERVVAAPVEPLRRYAAKVANARKRDADQ